MPAVLDLDLFDETVLLDPYPSHQAIREAGPVVKLAPYGLWASARFETVQAALQDWETFSSARGVGLADFARETPFRKPSLVLEADPPLHTRTRKILAMALSPQVLAGLRAGFLAEAERLVDSLLDRPIDGVADLAKVFPIRVFADALGLPEAGRENLLPYGALAFNAFGPRNAVFQRCYAEAEPAIAWVTAHCKRAALSPDGLGARVFAAADAGEATEEEAELLVRSFLSAGLDTTVHGLANMLFCFASHPDQWAILREQPGLVRQAFEEVLRFEAPVQTFFRTTTRKVELGGAILGEGEKIVLFLGGANRDPRRWDDPDRFDIRRRAGGHLAFGAGIHGCVGQMAARLEAEAMLTAMLRRVREIEMVGAPVHEANNTLRSLARLPIRLAA